MKLYAPLPLVNEPSTYLTASASAAATSLTVANNAGFTALDYTVIGKPGEEQTTIKKTSTLTGTGTINYVGDAIDFAISINTPVTFIKYNQVKFYLGDWSARYKTGTIAVVKDSKTVTGTGTTFTGLNTTYSLLLNGKWYDISSVDSATQVTLTENYRDNDMDGQTYAMVAFVSQTTAGLAPDQKYTIWDDTDASAEDYYRYEYFNKTTTLAATKSSITSAGEEFVEQKGFSEYAVISLENQVLSEMRDPDAKRRNRTEIRIDLNDALKDLVSTIVSDVQENYLSSRDTIDFEADVEEYEFPEDFRKLTMAWLKYSGADYKKANKMDLADDHPNASYSESVPNIYLRGNIIGIKPTPTSDVTDGIKLWYERRMPSFRYDGDEIPNILKDYKRLFIDYALEKACLGDDKAAKSVGYKLSYTDGKRLMAESLTNRDLETNNSVQIEVDQDLYEN